MLIAPALPPPARLRRSTSVRTARTERFAPIDAVRGFFLLLMAINHIPSPLHAVTDHPFGFMSAAEGFVFVAGLMAGYTYTRTGLRAGYPTLKHTCIQRAATIYRWHAGMFIAVCAGLILAGLQTGAFPPNTPGPLINQPISAAVAGLLLAFQPALFDILPMYCVLLLATPWCLRLCSKNQYTRLVLGSLALWAFANIFCAQTPYASGVIATGAFNLAAWQLLYISGLAFGHRWARRSATSATPTAPDFLLPTPGTPRLVAITAIAAFLFCVRHGFLGSGLAPATLDALTNKNNLAPIRLLDTALILLLGYFAISRFPRAFSLKPLAWIGRASLTVFSVHVLAAYALQANPVLFAETAAGRWLGTLLMLAALATAAFLHPFLQRGKPASPAPATALQTRHPRPRAVIVQHEPRASFPADPLHR